MSIICLFGEDGVGKTTLTHLLVDHLRSKGYKVRRVWMRGSHTLASLLSRFLSKFRAFRWIENPYYGVSFPSSIAKLWWFIEYISVIPIIITRYLIPSMLGIIVVADRYILDFIIWVSIITNNVSFKESIYARHLLTLSGRNTIKFYITASGEEIHHRSNEKIMQLNKQKHLYESLAGDAYKIDTTKKTPQESLRDITIVLRDLVI